MLWNWNWLYHIGRGKVNQDKAVSTVLLVWVVTSLSSCAEPQGTPLLDAAPRENIRLEYNNRMLLVTHPLLGEEPLMCN